MELFFQIGQALNYLHQEKGCIHQDIKPENFFIKNELNLETKKKYHKVVLADLGFCEKAEKMKNF